LRAGPQHCCRPYARAGTLACKASAG